MHFHFVGEKKKYYLYIYIIRLFYPQEMGTMQVKCYNIKLFKIK